MARERLSGGGKGLERERSSVGVMTEVVSSAGGFVTLVLSILSMKSNFFITLSGRGANNLAFMAALCLFFSYAALAFSSSSASSVLGGSSSVYGTSAGFSVIGCFSRTSLKRSLTGFLGTSGLLPSKKMSYSKASC